MDGIWIPHGRSIHPAVHQIRLVPVPSPIIPLAVGDPPSRSISHVPSRPQGGHYARFMANRLAPSDRFGVLATNASLHAPAVFSFWYFMHGSQIGTLSLLVDDQIVWQKSRRQGAPAWYQASVTLTSGGSVEVRLSSLRHERRHEGESRSPF